MSRSQQLQIRLNQAIELFIKDLLPIETEQGFIFLSRPVKLNRRLYNLSISLLPGTCIFCQQQLEGGEGVQICNSCNDKYRQKLDEIK